MLFKNRRAMYEIYIKFLFRKSMFYNMILAPQTPKGELRYY